jgi:hypothetical protein
MAGDDSTYQLSIVSCKLYILAIDLMDGLSLNIQRHLETKPARYGNNPDSNYMHPLIQLFDALS